MQREEEERANAYQDRIDAKAALKNSKLSQEEKKKKDEQRVLEARHERKLEEKRTNEEFSKKFEDEKEKERMKTEVRRKEIARSAEFNLQLIDRKEQQRQQDREDATAYRYTMQREAEKQRASDIAKAEKKKMLMYEVKFTLDEQVRKFNSRKVDDGVLSDKERALNKVHVTQ